MPELQDILIQHADDYSLNHPISYTQKKVINALKKCRTSSLGGHVTICDDCGNKQISYNSCRNRHCPKCQTLSKVVYFLVYGHTSIHLPHNVICFSNDLAAISLAFFLQAKASKNSSRSSLGFQVSPEIAFIFLIAVTNSIRCSTNSSISSRHACLYSTIFLLTYKMNNILHCLDCDYLINIMSSWIAQQIGMQVDCKITLKLN